MSAPAQFLSASLSWPVWPRHAACLALLTPLLSLAQGPTAADPTADAARPDAVTAPLIYHNLAPVPPLADAAPSPQSWREGHAAVAAFPRGHADIVAWEAKQGTSAPSAAAGATATKPEGPAQPSMQHGTQGGIPPKHSHHPLHGGKP